jgi:hypothetical protein
MSMSVRPPPTTSRVRANADEAVLTPPAVRVSDVKQALVLETPCRHGQLCRHAGHAVAPSLYLTTHNRYGARLCSSLQHVPTKSGSVHTG